MNEYGADYARYQSQRGRFRKLVRRIYLRSAASQLNGATVDLGCGVGELLCRLPKGSIGLDINPVSVAHCQKRGLDARIYDGEADQWSLSSLRGRTDLRSLVVSHVLEHLDEPMDKLSGLLSACTRLGIQRALVIVPGRRGFASDATHRTFIDTAMLSDARVTRDSGFALASIHHFPIDTAAAGNLFTHLELQAVFDGRPKANLATQTQ